MSKLLFKQLKHRKISKSQHVIQYYIHRLFCSNVSITTDEFNTGYIEEQKYIPPTYSEIIEYTQTIASVLHSWPLESRDFFLGTLHKAQANPKRNKNYDLILNSSKIPKRYLKALDYSKLSNLLPYIYVNDIVEIMNEIKESPLLSCIHKDGELVAFDGNNQEHQELLDHIQSYEYDKMIWVRDISMTTTDIKLAEIFSKFGDISAIIMDREQSVKQEKWLKYKQKELEQDQQNELNNVINKLRNDMNKNMVNDYQQQYLKVELNIANNYDILRLIMAHLQHQFDIKDLKILNNEILLVPVCFDGTISEILHPIKNSINDIQFYHEYGNIIISLLPENEHFVRNILQSNRLVGDYKRIKSESSRNELEIRFVSKIESSIKDFISSLCTDYYNLDSSALVIHHHTPHEIPLWYRSLNEQSIKNNEFFSCNQDDVDHGIQSISNRIKRISNDGDEELINNTKYKPTCSAFIYFKHKDALDSLLCDHTRIFGMVINGARCKLSTSPTQLLFKNVPYNPFNSLLFTPYFKPSTKEFELESMNHDIYYNEQNEMITPIFKRFVEPTKTHIPIGSEHVQFQIPLSVDVHNNNNGLQSVYSFTTKYQHTFSHNELDSRLNYEIPGILESNLKLLDKTILLMKYSETINVALPIIGGVIKNMLLLTPSSNNNNKLFKLENIENNHRNIPIMADKINININEIDIDNILTNDISYSWKHSSATFEDNEMLWYKDDDINTSNIKSNKIKSKLTESVFARMGCVWCYSKRYRRINIISHGIKLWNGETPNILLVKNKKNKIADEDEEEEDGDGFNNLLDNFLSDDSDSDHDHDNDELQELLFGSDIDNDCTQILSKSVIPKTFKQNSSADSESEHINKREIDLELGQKLVIYVNGNKHSFCSHVDADADGENEEILLSRGWNQILFDFGFNDIAAASFQIIDHVQKSEIDDLYWRYSPPPTSIILQYDNHLNANKTYQKLKEYSRNIKQKRYGIKMDYAGFDEHFLEDNTVLQTVYNQNNYGNKINGESLPSLKVDEDEFKSCSSSSEYSLESFINGVVENVNKSIAEFENKEKTENYETIQHQTKEYKHLLSHYNPCQVLYDNDNETTNETESLGTSLKMPSTLELLEYPFDDDEINEENDDATNNENDEDEEEDEDGDEDEDEL